MNALQKQNLAEWKDRNSTKYVAMRQAMKEGKTMGAWKEVSKLITTFVRRKLAYPSSTAVAQ